MKPLNYIKEIRWKQNITLDELAKRTGLSKSAISMVENGQRIPTQYSILKLSKAFDMDASEVFMLNWKDLDI